MNRTIKRIIASCSCAILVLACAGCGNEKDQTNETEKEAQNISIDNETVRSNYDKPAIPLDEDEIELLSLVEADINYITDQNYAEVVPELAAHTGEFSGYLYQIEGLCLLDGDTPYVARTLVNGKKKTTSGLPLKYMEKTIEEGSWIRVTGVIQEGEIDGETVNVLEVIAIESLSAMGQSELTWSGASHSHE